MHRCGWIWYGDSRSILVVALQDRQRAWRGTHRTKGTDGDEGSDL